ncbi:MAG: glycosyltransferase family 2 protein [Provencibacterium sp.]|jgi:glycosyltransferase involved in cell wall biosynthesis|nr:glycosyltransferase family 2 protein [Provencibacterium sp.]
MMKILIIIPAFNEQENIERVVDKLIDCYPQYSYVVVNDGSRDDTARICQKRGYHLINLPVNLGLAGAFQAGMRYAYELGFDAAVQLDGDGQHNPEYIAAMAEAMTAQDADIVIGSRFKEKRKPKNLRMLGSNLIEAAIRLTTGTKISDPTSGMRLFSRRMLRLFANNVNYGPEPDTVSYLIRCGARVTEVQTQMNERIAGESYLNFSRSVIYMAHMFFSIVFIQFVRKKEETPCLPHSALS